MNGGGKAASIFSNQSAQAQALNPAPFSYVARRVGNSGVPDCIFFFFQAEDGIRDIGVTGVQTCALPISLAELAEGATPPRVVIDEAVKLAHWFAGAKAPAFVNGVLDAVAREFGAL